MGVSYHSGQPLLNTDNITLTQELLERVRGCTHTFEFLAHNNKQRFPISDSLVKIHSLLPLSSKTTSEGSCPGSSGSY